ncbi:MAG TPA: NAD(P)-binding domain-containing protein, partial [Gammaproteobacteria bacterium]|nr:NAD(P)-binding domain-containing protein [Gammaproteobacteria bacterium]
MAGTVDAVVVGAGHSGLAMSHALAAHGVEHVVLERGEIANAWRHERWDSLRLLTPNWQSRLPGYRYSGSDPDGYMTSAEVVDFIDGYAKFVGAPVRTGTTVAKLRPDDDGGYVVETDRGAWRCR